VVVMVTVVVMMVMMMVKMMMMMLMHKGRVTLQALKPTPQPQPSHLREQTRVLYPIETRGQRLRPRKCIAHQRCTGAAVTQLGGHHRTAHEHAALGI